MSAAVASPDERAPEPVPAVEAAEVVALPSVRGVAGGLVGALARPRALAGETVRLGRDFALILRGTERIAPERDERFADPAWREHPGYRRLGQAYLAWGSSLARLVDRYEAEGADWHDVEQARFALNALTGGMAPTNTLLGNPAALKRAIETGGRSVLRGMGHLVEDLRHHGGLPAPADRAQFAVGRNLGVTRGAVVYRDDVLELLQYQPSTQRVRQRPVVIVPPPIGRFYFLDLRPGRSFTEYAVGQGLQTFMISWRNPARKHAGWTLDTYAERIRRVIGVAREITGSPDVNTIGFCAGGILLTTLLTHFAAIADRSVHSAGYAVTLLDFTTPAPIAAFAGRRLGAGQRTSGRRGVIPARTMESAFSWMHPDELVFGSLVHQWLLGEDPAASDLLAWYADGTNLPAALHKQFLQIFRDNTLLRPGALTVLGTPVDLAEITLPTLVLAAADDHLTPWTGCYRTTQLLSGPATFLLSSGGHLQSLITPPGHPTASYWTGGPAAPDPEDWLATAQRHTGSWWQAWAPWTLARSGDEMPAPAGLGSALHPPLQPAPGAYVLDRPPA